MNRFKVFVYHVVLPVLWCALVTGMMVIGVVIGALDDLDFG